VDAWDAIQDNEFFSVEGFIFAFSQMFQVLLSCPPAAAKLLDPDSRPAGHTRH
jgi:hypothetical protein